MPLFSNFKIPFPKVFCVYSLSFCPVYLPKALKGKETPRTRKRYKTEYSAIS